MIRSTVIVSLLLVFFLDTTSALSREHIIEQGDTISKIARHYGVTQKALMRLNNIDTPTRLHLGDVLMIPDQLRGNARRKHVVRQGDTLISIAKKYRVKKRDIRELNQIPKRGILSVGQTLAIPNRLGDPGPKTPIEEQQKHPQRSTQTTSLNRSSWSGGVKGLVRSGIKVDGGVKHTVQKGQTVAMIARAYNQDAKRLARRLRINRRNPLKAGQEILISGAARPVPVRTREYRPHRIRFVRIKNTKRMKLTLINRSGTLNQRSYTAIRRLLGYRRMHPRLVILLQKVAERFPGHAIEIISGYRKPTKRRRGKKSSPHSRGVAVDFRLQGVSNELLYEYISSFDKVGAGYYPHSIHVHLDVRKKKYLWTDVSQRGEPALYVNPGDAGHWETIKDTIIDETAATQGAESDSE